MKLIADTQCSVCVLPKYRGTHEGEELGQKIIEINSKFRKQLIEELENIGFVEENKQHVFESKNEQEVIQMRDKANKLIDNWKSQFDGILDKVRIPNYGTVLQK